MIARQPRLGASRGPERAAPPTDGRDSLSHAPNLLAASWDSGTPAPDLSALTLRFSGERDEEYIELTARDDRRAIDLGVRAHHAVLLALARSRLEDRKACAVSPMELRTSRSDGSEGWVSLNDLMDMLAMAETHLKSIGPIVTADNVRDLSLAVCSMLCVRSARL